MVQWMFIRTTYQSLDDHLHYEEEPDLRTYVHTCVSDSYGRLAGWQIIN